MAQAMQPPPRRRTGLNILILIIGVILIIVLVNALRPTPDSISFTRFVELMGIERTGDNTIFPPDQNEIHSVVQQGNNFFILTTYQINQDRIDSFWSNPARNATYRMFYQNHFEISDLISRQNQAVGSAHRIQFETRSVPQSWLEIIFMILPILFIAVIAFFILRNLSGRGGVMTMGRHRASVVISSPIRFADVAGIEEEKAEVEEIVQFLRNPQKFLDLGARIPKGFLLIGSPGTGKTMLAKAIAGEAGVPFFSISGSDFSEMLVGVGPSRMRHLFEEAKANAPCIIFIDEIDSIARMRGVGISGAAEENEQTLNQLLVQMDGFTKSEGVIVLAATNRPDVLDQALLRPGRFDRHIVVQMPDVAGREKILYVHTKNKPIASDVDLKRVAQIISGFTGADIENLMNEAAIIAAKHNRRKITMADITEGINKVLLGPQKRSRIINDEDKRITAFHEAGHAIISRVLQPKQTVQEVSIIPRGMAAGYTLTNDKDDVTAHKSKSFLKTQLAMLMGGRAAEQIFIGDVCTGAQQDLKVATGLAEKMVTMFGMSDKLGPIFYGRHDEALMRAYDDKNVSESQQSIIDGEIRALMLEAEKTAQDIMKKYTKQVNVMVDALLLHETIYAEDIDLIMEGATSEDVTANIEARLERSRKSQDQDRIDHELGLLEGEIARIDAMAQLFFTQGITDEETLGKLKQNFEIARTVVREGKPLAYLPTLDNVENYAMLVGVVDESVTPKTPKTEEVTVITPAAQKPKEKKKTTTRSKTSEEKKDN